MRDPDERFSTAAAMRRAIENAAVELKIQSSNEDVADFVRTNLPEFAEKRRSVMSKAIAEADERGSSRSLVSADELHPEEAFAPTVVSARSPGADRVTRPDPKPADAAIPLVAKKAAQASGAAVPSARAVLEGRVAADETVGGAFTDEEMAAIPKRRGAWWLLAFVAIGAGAFLGWPQGVARVKKLFATAAAPTASATSEPSAATSASGAPSAAIPAAPSASAAATASSSATPLAALDAGAPAASAAHSHVQPTSHDVGFTSGPTVEPAPTTTATATATATVAPPPPATETPPTATATSNPPPEENNPY